MSDFSAATRTLRRRLGSQVVFIDAASRAYAAFDSAKLPFRPAALIRVRKESEVGVVLALANKYRVPVTTRGRGTTLTGAATPIRGGWVLDTLKLKRIAIDDVSGMAHVGAGADRKSTRLNSSHTDISSMPYSA